jgi:hypothetical protein
MVSAAYAQQPTMLPSVVLLLIACGTEPPPSDRADAVPDVLADAPTTARRETFQEMWDDARAPRSAGDGGGTVSCS